MTKVLNAYRANPTNANARKVRAYERSHPMSRCMLSAPDLDLLADAIHQANSGQINHARFATAADVAAHYHG